MANAAGQEHEAGPIRRAATRALEAAVQEGELVAGERVLGHQRRRTPRQSGERADSAGCDSRARGGQGPQAEQRADRQRRLLLRERCELEREERGAAVSRSGHGVA